jgi:UDP-glucuronate 4-epimerase
VKFLVTGAAGFIGSNLSATLARSGFDVIGIDNFSPYYSPKLKECRVDKILTPNGILVERIDLSDLGSTQAIVNSFRPDFIIHLAAQPGVRTPLRNSDQYIQNNLVAYSNVLQVAVEAEVPNFLYASSSSVYGNSTTLPYKENDSSIKPISIYGATKLANEILAPAYISGSKTKARGMRFFTVYGPWGRPDMAYFRLIDSALNGSEFKKFGAGEVKRDFTFVDDITAMIESLALQLNTLPYSYSDVVNIGGGNPYSLNDLIEMISGQIDSRVAISQYEGNPNDTKYTSADTTNLLTLTGKKPEIDLRAGVTKTIEWASQLGIREHLSGWTRSTN